MQVHGDKTLVNFEVAVEGKHVKRLVGSRKFPYCGSFIDTQTLDVSKDRERGRGLGEWFIHSRDVMVGDANTKNSDRRFFDRGVFENSGQDFSSKGSE